MGSLGLLAIAAILAGQPASSPSSPPSSSSSSSPSSARTEADAGAGGTMLDMPPVLQLSPVWCWLAVGEMVFRFYEVPFVNDAAQCGIIGLLSMGTRNERCVRDCRQCNVPAGDAQTMLHLFVDYPRRVKALPAYRDVDVPRLFVSRTGPLPLADLVRELDGGRPVVAGITPMVMRAAGGTKRTDAAHVVVIVGWRPTPDGALVIVNDPYPYGPQSLRDPWLDVGATLTAPGQYILGLEDFTRALAWTDTFLVRGDGWHRAP